MNVQDYDLQFNKKVSTSQGVKYIYLWIVMYPSDLFRRLPFYKA